MRSAHVRSSLKSVSLGPSSVPDGRLSESRKLGKFNGIEMSSMPGLTLDTSHPFTDGVNTAR